jgi:hypothetical protein
VGGGGAWGEGAPGRGGPASHHRARAERRALGIWHGRGSAGGRRRRARPAAPRRRRPAPPPQTLNAQQTLIGPTPLQVLPVLLDACAASHADLRQCAAYGVGVVAAQAPDVLRPQAQAALARLLAIVQAPVRGGPAARFSAVGFGAAAGAKGHCLKPRPTDALHCFSPNTSACKPSINCEMPIDSPEP